MPNRIIQVFEYEQLTLFEDSRGRRLKEQELESLLKFNDENTNKYFVPIHKGIKFNSFVGVLQVGNLTLEILPKSDRQKANGSESYAQWRDALLTMLNVCNKMNVDAINEAHLKKRPFSLLEIYFHLYLIEVEKLLHQGLFKKYKVISGNLKAWKGRMNFSKNITYNIVRKERFYTTHQTYNYDHLINQILYKGLKVVSQVCANIEIQGKSKKLLACFPEIKDVRITESSFKKIQSSRKLYSFKKALDIAQLLILNYSPEIKSGNTKLLALIFDMNKLWEEYLYRMLKKVQRENFEVWAQSSKKFWENKTVRPDIVLNIDGQTYVIDAKWKIINQNKPSDADLKQMYVYNMYWEAEKSLLLYPSSENKKEKFGSFWKGREGKNLCKLGFVSVLKPDGTIDLEIGNKILDKLS